MEFKDTNDRLYSALQDIYYNCETRYSITLGWQGFVKEQDIGLQYLSYDRYKITDEKKWLLTKIKYGI